MGLLRFLPTAICRHQRTTVFVIFSVIVLIVIFQSQHDGDYTPPKYYFEDGVAYCNAPNRISSRMNNRTFPGFNLIQVQILIRHGDRAPIDLKALPNTDPIHISCLFNDTVRTYEMELAKIRNIAKRNIFQVKGSDKHRIVNEKPTCRGGQLTPYGYLQHLYLGNLFSKTYKDFLVGINLKKDLHVQATDVSRTIQSGISFLSGAFYDHLLEKAPKVDVHVHKDHVLHGHFLLDESFTSLTCPALRRRTLTIHESRPVKLFLKSTDHMVQKMANMLLVPRDQMPKFNRLVDILFARLCHGHGVPLGPVYRLPNSLVKQALQFAHMYVKVFHSDLAELQTLSILSQISIRILDLIRDLPTAKKIVMYSGHDTTLAPFLQMLGTWDGKWPPYASNIFIEVYEKKDQADHSVKGRIESVYFRIVYNGVALKNVKFCISAGDGELCPLTDLLRYVSNMIYDPALVTKMEGSAMNELMFSRIRKLCLKSD